MDLNERKEIDLVAHGTSWAKEEYRKDNKMNETKKCKYCKTDIPQDAKVCPNCRRKQGPKVGLIVLVVIIALVFVSCIAGTGKKETVTVTSSDVSDTSSVSSTSSTATSTATTLDEQVIYDKNDIKVTVTGMSGTQIEVAIENNTNRNICIQLRDVCVNGLMADAIFSSEVAPGKKANDDISLWGLSEQGITDVATVEFSLYIFDWDTWDTIDDSETITLNTSIAGSYTQSVDDSGEVLVDNGSIKVVNKGKSGSTIILYIENNSNRAITVQARDISVDGYMADAIMSDDITAGRAKFVSMDVIDYDGDLKNVEFSLHIFDEDTWSTILDTNTLTVE